MFALFGESWSWARPNNTTFFVILGERGQHCVINWPVEVSERLRKFLRRDGEPEVGLLLGAAPEWPLLQAVGDDKPSAKGSMKQR